MTLISTFIALCFLCIIIVALVWVGFYVVFPIVLFFMVVSAIGSLIKEFMPCKKTTYSRENLQKNDENQIIDVEYEEIK